ncbi:hypothetical protein [Bradyrhizobium sp.]|uniref:hypothetical protein n=1 Tax=Bradyrhizobium sp. TaxID=376 RepID=UPI002D7F721B|nr:hypothetical protein [Bradyrhizobium sp.]
MTKMKMLGAVAILSAANRYAGAGSGRGFWGREAAMVCRRGPDPGITFAHIIFFARIIFAGIIGRVSRISTR